MISRGCEEEAKNKITYVVDSDLEGRKFGGISSNGFAIGQCYKEYIMHNGARTYNPDLNPGVPDVSSNASHGLRKLDCVTVWFLGWNSNVTVSPMEAVMLAGS